VQVTISKDDTIVLDGAGQKKDIQERCELIRQTAQATTSEWEKEKLNERLAKMVGGVAVRPTSFASPLHFNAPHFASRFTPPTPFAGDQSRWR
jgi:hypothetical protein